MSYTTVRPEALAGIAGELMKINSMARAADELAAGRTTGVVPAAADLVSQVLAAQFAAHGESYQAVGAQAATVRELLTVNLAANACLYAEIEAANAVRVA